MLSIAFIFFSKFIRYCKMCEYSLSIKTWKSTAFTYSFNTTFTTPYFIRLANPFAEWLYKILPTKVQETLDRYASGKKTMNHDSDWKKLLKNMIGRVVIYSVLLTAIWLLSIQIIYPAISEMFTPITIWIKLVMCLGTLLLMTPFLWALISNKYNSSELFLKLWRDENYNHGRLVSLVLGRVSVALFFITSVVISYFKLNWGISVIIAIAVVALILILREVGIHENSSHLFSSKLFQQPRIFALEI